jgi:flagellar protein FlgJ
MEYIKIYILLVYKQAIKAAKAYDINPYIILAQGALESDYGRSLNAKAANNYFGVTAAGSPNQYWNGEYRTAGTGLKFRKSKTIEDSFMDFARLIRSKYTNAANASMNVAEYARLISLSSYISEANGDNREGYRLGLIARYNAIADVLKKKLSYLLQELPPLQD